MRMKNRQQISEAITQLQNYRDRLEPGSPEYEKVNTTVEALFWVLFPRFLDMAWLPLPKIEEDNR